jgi:hypothetical protein
MAHFYGMMNGGTGGPRTKTGTKKTGLSAHIRGWHVGCFVECKYKDGKDIIEIYETKGSMGAKDRKLLHVLTYDNKKGGDKEA